MGVKFTAVTSNFDEQLDDSRSPVEVAKELGLGKALAVAVNYPEAIVIGSDQVVAVGNHQLGKPKNAVEARDMYKVFAQQPHEVVTSIVVVCLEMDLQLIEVGRARVFFKPYDNEAVEAYLRTGDYLDKAGGYGIQGGASQLIDHFEGEFDTIVGLPTHVLAPMLKRLGISAQPVGLVPPEDLVAK